MVASSPRPSTSRQFAHSGPHSPLLNDVWPLGIILLDLTGRNPLKSTSLSDPTPCAYLQDPTRFLPAVLPVSDEVNGLLVRVLDVDWVRSSGPRIQHSPQSYSR